MNLVPQDHSTMYRLVDETSSRYISVPDVKLILGLVGKTTGPILEIGACEGMLSTEIYAAYPQRKLYALDYFGMTTMCKEQAPQQPQYGRFMHFFHEHVYRWKIMHHGVHPLNVNSMALDYATMTPDVDTIIIDGDVSFQGVMSDSILAISYLKQKPIGHRGLVIWHNASSSDCPDWCQVWSVLCAIEGNALASVNVIEKSKLAFTYIDGTI